MTPGFQNVAASGVYVTFFDTCIQQCYVGRLGVSCSVCGCSEWFAKNLCDLMGCAACVHAGVCVLLCHHTVRLVSQALSRVFPIFEQNRWVCLCVSAYVHNCMTPDSGRICCT